MLTKSHITELKNSGNGGLKNFVATLEDDKSKVFVLENLGRLPENFEGDWIADFLKSENKKLRMSAVRNIGKLETTEHNHLLYEIAKNDKDTIIRREAVSSLGRQRTSENKNFFIEILQDKDPKVVMQAMRALLVFKKEEEIAKKLKELRQHPNEMIQEVIEKEFFPKPSNPDKPTHASSPLFMQNVVVNGDVLEVLKNVPDESIHLTFTSPPYYNARDYSIYQSYQEYLDFLAEVFKATHRVTKEGRFLIVNTSPIIIPRFSRAYSSKRYPIPFDLHAILVKQDWEFIDDIVWAKPETSVKNRNGGFQQHRKPLGYKPNATTEMVMVYRKKTDKLIDWNMQQYSKEIIEASKIKEDDFETSNLWKIDPTFDKIHSAVFPVEFCKRIIRFYSFKNDLVFDPFGGSGTFGRVAKSLDRYFFLTEIDETYFEYMQSKKSKMSLSWERRETDFLSLENFKNKTNDTNRPSS